MQNIHRQSGVWFIPAIAGILKAIAAVGTFLFTFITVTLSSWILKIATTLAILAIYTAAVYAIYTGMSAVVDSIGNATPTMPNEFHIAASWFVPPNVDQFITGIMTIGFLKLVFRHKNRVLDIVRQGAN